MAFETFINLFSDDTEQKDKVLYKFFINSSFLSFGPV